MKVLKEYYREYLKTREWRFFRQQAFNHYGKKCNRCESELRLEVHHKHYRNLGKEELKDVEILCHSCHQSLHKRKKLTNKKPSKYMRNPHYDTTPVTYYPNL